MIVQTDANDCANIFKILHKHDVFCVYEYRNLIGLDCVNDCANVCANIGAWLHKFKHTFALSNHLLWA